MLEQLDTNDQLCLSLQHVKAQLRLDHADDDDYLAELIKSGTNWVENHLGRCLLKQTWRLTKNVNSLKMIRGKPTIRLPKSPLLSVLSVRTVEAHGKEGRNILNYSLSWDKDPATITLPPSFLFGMVEIVFITGYGERSVDIPADIRQAILNYVSCLYEERRGIDRKDLLGIYNLLQPHRLLRLS